jgi:hypothetical protein
MALATEKENPRMCTHSERVSCAEAFVRGSISGCHCLSLCVIYI